MTLDMQLQELLGSNDASFSGFSLISFSVTKLQPQPNQFFFCNARRIDFFFSSYSTSLLKFRRYDHVYQAEVLDLLIVL